MTSQKQDGSTLSQRQCQILDLVCEGKSNKEIARIVKLDDTTVKGHMTKILAHYQLTNRKQVIAMRKFGKLDANHNEIVDALRRCGASVVSLASVGNGVPDLLVGFNGRTCLLEVKDGSKPPSHQSLTDAQLDFISKWRGSSVAIVNSVDGALRVLGVMK